MTDSNPDSKPGSKWLWILLLLALLILVIVWFRDPLGDVEQAPPAEPTPQSTEWTPAPEESGVPVTLPTTDLAPATEEGTGGAGSSSGASE